MHMLAAKLAIALLLGAVSAVAIAAGTSKRHTKPSVLLLGSRSVATQPDTDAAGRSEAFPFPGLHAGTAVSVHLYVDRANNAKTVLAAIYSSSGGLPGKLLSWGSLSHPTAARWNVISIRSTYVYAGRAYWLALLGTGGTLAYRDHQSSSCGSVEAAEARLNKFPSRWRSGRTWTTCALSAYLMGTRAAPATPPPKQKTPPPKSTPTHTQPPTSTSTPTTTPSSCFAAPGACGYPDPKYHNTGATSSCSSLKSSGSITASTPGETLQNLNINGGIAVTAPNVTINNVCVTMNGGGQIGSIAVNLESGASNTLIEHSTIGGANTTNASVDIAVRNVSDHSATATSDYFYNCGECVHDNPWTLNNSYVISNGMVNTDDHYEAIYCDSSTMSLTHDTLLNPEPQTAVLFCNASNGGGGGCVNHISLTNSLLAGGGIMIYTCGNASSVGSSTSNITGNRFARCTTPPIHFNSQSGGSTCQGDTGYGGADSHGYFPKGGYFLVDDYDTYCPPTSGQTWSNNVWDDNNAPLAC